MTPEQLIELQDGWLRCQEKLFCLKAIMSTHYLLSQTPEVVNIPETQELLERLGTRFNKRVDLLKRIKPKDDDCYDSVRQQLIYLNGYINKLNYKMNVIIDQCFN